MPEPESHKAQTAEERTDEAKSFLRRVRRATRRKHTAEENIRIVMERFGQEVTVNDLCRREGIKPHSYYPWTKEFIEASKERLARDTLRDATQEEVQALCLPRNPGRPPRNTVGFRRYWPTGMNEARWAMAITSYPANRCTVGSRQRSGELRCRVLAGPLAPRIRRRWRCGGPADPSPARPPPRQACA